MSRSRRAAATVMTPPAGVARVALVTRLTMTRSIWSRSASTAGRSGVASTSRRSPLASTWRRSDSAASRTRTDGRIGARTGAAAPDSIFDRSSSCAHQAIEPRRVVAAHLQDLLLTFVERARHALEQQVDAHLDAGQRRAQLVRRCGDELGFEPADLAQVRDVLEQRDGADEPIVGVAHRRRPHAERAPRCRRRPTAALPQRSPTPPPARTAARR